MTHFNNDIVWLQELGYCQEHKTCKRDRRLVAGIVRAKLKEESRREMNDNIQSWAGVIIITTHHCARG